MRTWLLFLAICLIYTSASAQNEQAITRANIAAILGFEGSAPANTLPKGWRSSVSSETSIDTVVIHSGLQSLRIERNATSANTFTPVSATIPADFTGRQITLRGYLRVEGVKGDASLWLREDSDGDMASFANSEDQHFDGTADWRQFSITIPAKEEATTLIAGVFLSGTGTAWFDDLELLVDDQPIAAAPARIATPTVLDTDHEFAEGSRIHVAALTDRQVENLATLAEVWGFLKYHHPAITSGKRNWDADLFRIMPAILSAHTAVERNARLLHWINDLGPIPPCSPCVQLDKTNLQSSPDILWIRDHQRLGSALSTQLQNIYVQRTSGPQFYLDLQPGVNNPAFQHESNYARMKLPDAGYQLLALFRWWNMLEWQSPNRYLDPGWHQVLRTHMRPIVTAQDKQDFARAMMQLIGEAHDSHANLWSSLTLRPPMGACKVPVALRFIGKSAVVWSVLDSSSQMQRGDTIESIDSHPLAGLIRDWLPFYTGSNEAARMRDIAQQMTSGACGPVKLDIRRNGLPMQIESTRIGATTDGFKSSWHDQSGPTFRLLSKDIAYLKLSTIKLSDIPEYMRQAIGTKGLVIDIRNYPSQFAVFDLGQRLIEQPTSFVNFTRADLGNPGAFHRSDGPQLKPQSPNYPGRVIILVDEGSQSQAEYTAMALRTSPGALVIGSQTAGADGNVSTIPLPFGMSSYLSGLGVFTPIGGQTQRIGIVRDIEAVPTITGIAAGRDEVLEVALRKILGDTVPQSEIESMAHREK